MSHKVKVYRLCLLSVAFLAIVGGIFYYLNYVQDIPKSNEGTLVFEELQNNNNILEYRTKDTQVKWA